MADPDGQDFETGGLTEAERLENDNAELKRELFIADSVVTEFRQALADTQLALAKANAQLKLAQQPTA